MAVNYTKWQNYKQMAIKYTNIFHSKTLQNIPKLGFLLCKYTLWQPLSQMAAVLLDYVTTTDELGCSVIDQR
jgi:hypothetical protein